MKHPTRRRTADTLRLWTLCAAFALSAAVLAAVTWTAVKRPAAPAAADADGNISEYYTPNGETSQEHTEPSRVNSENIQNSGDGAPYTVRAFGDTVAVFARDGIAPLHTIDTPLSRLPEADRRLLREGIPAETLPAALKIIEDYE